VKTRSRVSLTAEEKERIQNSYKGRSDEIVVTAFRTEFLRKDLCTLKGTTWLNDEVVNMWMNLLQQRDDEAVKASNGTKAGSHYFSSFFLAKLLEKGTYTFANVKRWTKSFDIFAKDKVFMPVNINSTHWCMLVVYMQEKRIEYYDSMNGSGGYYLNAALRYLAEEYSIKKKGVMNQDEWELKSRVSTWIPAFTHLSLWITYPVFLMLDVPVFFFFGLGVLTFYPGPSRL
jgi:Ulp1 family protease